MSSPPYEDVILTTVVVVGEIHGERDLVEVVELHRLHGRARGDVSLYSDRRLPVPVAVFVSEFRPMFRRCAERKSKVRSETVAARNDDATVDSQHIYIEPEVGAETKQER